MSFLLSSNKRILDSVPFFRETINKEFYICKSSKTIITRQGPSPSDGAWYQVTRNSPLLSSSSVPHCAHLAAVQVAALLLTLLLWHVLTLLLGNVLGDQCWFRSIIKFTRSLPQHYWNNIINWKSIWILPCTFSEELPCRISSAPWNTGKGQIMKSASCLSDFFTPQKINYSKDFS